ncbi:MAG TPA: hypothetical protein VKR06_08210 [Ktedonosporobacter sp.]|nr:hypothetical protein [Ktedonosporobacter sp.]
MAYRGTYINQDPLNYFLKSSAEDPHLHVADVVLRENKDPKKI